jgi:beta-phosphoglucomutase family hydrolase
VSFVALRGPGWTAAAAVSAVIFDLDGVVTDTATIHARAWKSLFDEFLSARPAAAGEDHRAFSDDDYRRFVDGKARHDGVDSFLQSRGIQLEAGHPGDDPGALTVYGLGNAKNRRFLEVVAAEGVPVFDATVEFVRALKRRGVQTAVVSASENCAAVLEAAGVAALFEERVDGLDALVLGLPGKPDPALFLEAARRLGVAPGRAAVVEDAIAGVEAGRAGGFGVVIGVDRSRRGTELLRGGADMVVSGLGELDADAVG